MKSIKSNRLSGLNLVIYFVLLSLSIVVLSNIWVASNKQIFNPQPFDELRFDRPIIRIYNDVIFYLHEDIIKNNPEVYQKAQRNELLLNLLEM